MTSIRQRRDQLVGQCLRDGDIARLFSVTVSQAADIFDCSRSYAYRVLQGLVEQGILVKKSYFRLDGTADLYYFDNTVAMMIDAYEALDRRGIAPDVLQDGLDRFQQKRGQK